MTLLELTVVITILSIITVLAVSAFPASRHHQQLLSAEQTFQSYVREAQQMALDQKREEDCLNRAQAEGFEERLCAKVGVAFLGKEVVFFADITNSGRYNEDDDYEIRRMTLSDTVSVQPPVWHSFTFEAIPPLVTLWAWPGSGNPELINSPDDRADIILENLRGRQMELSVLPYGQVERKDI